MRATYEGAGSNAEVADDGFHVDLLDDAETGAGSHEGVQADRREVVRLGRQRSARVAAEEVLEGLAAGQGVEGLGHVDDEHHEHHCLVSGGYDEDGDVAHGVVAHDVGVGRRIVDRKAEVAEHADEEVYRETNEVLLCQDLVHPSESGQFQFLEALQEVNLGREAEHEHWEGRQTARGIEGGDAAVVLEVFARSRIEGVPYGDHHDVDHREETQKGVDS